MWYDCQELKNDEIGNIPYWHAIPFWSEEFTGMKIDIWGDLKQKNPTSFSIWIETKEIKEDCFQGEFMNLFIPVN